MLILVGVADDLPATVGAPAIIADYDKVHTFYSQLAVVGEPARAVLARLAGEYRKLA